MYIKDVVGGMYKKISPQRGEVLGKKCWKEQVPIFKK